jgi:hypothetical protein
MVGNIHKPHREPSNQELNDTPSVWSSWFYFFVYICSLYIVYIFFILLLNVPATGISSTNHSLPIFPHFSFACHFTNTHESKKTNQELIPSILQIQLCCFLLNNEHIGRQTSPNIDEIKIIMLPLLLRDRPFNSSRV